MHGCLLGFVLDPFTTLSALVLLRGSLLDCVFVRLLSGEAALCLYRSTITIILARTIIMGLSYRVHMLP